MNIQETGRRIVDKGLSGRFLSLTVVVITYCLILLGTIDLVKTKVLTWEGFITVFTPFALTAQGIIQSYYNRTDRKESTDETKNNGGTATG